MQVSDAVCNALLDKLLLSGKVNTTAEPPYLQLPAVAATM
jgi:hypothetical protein